MGCQEKGGAEALRPVGATMKRWASNFLPLQIHCTSQKHNSGRGPVLECPKTVFLDPEVLKNGRPVQLQFKFI